MRIYENGIYRDMTEEEIAALTADIEESERKYWDDISYDEAVDAEIRKKYSVSQEFAILRQKDEKPEEYSEYFAYCEQCKAYVKEKKSIGGN